MKQIIMSNLLLTTLLSLGLPTNLESHNIYSDNASSPDRNVLMSTILLRPVENPSTHVARGRLLSGGDVDIIIDSAQDDDNSHTLLFSEGRKEGQSGTKDSDDTADIGHRDESCIVIDKCAYCTDFKNNPSGACRDTGRRERVECEYFTGKR